MIIAINLLKGADDELNKIRNIDFIVNQIMYKKSINKLKSTMIDQLFLNIS